MGHEIPRVLGCIAMVTGVAGIGPGYAAVHTNVQTPLWPTAAAGLGSFLILLAVGANT